MTHTTTASLRKDVNRAKGPVKGSVVTFDRTKTIREGMRLDEGQIVLSYAAIFVAGKWYLTGTTGVGATAYRHDQFVELLADDAIHNIRVATEFEAL